VVAGKVRPSRIDTAAIWSFPEVPSHVSSPSLGMRMDRK
jgi:hypothetical protein